MEAFTTGSSHTNVIVITAEIESGCARVAKDDPFRCSPVSSCVAPLQTEVSMGGCQRQHKGDQGDTPEIMDGILTTARDLELEENEDDIKGVFLER
ncbi:hypothetical protein TNCV_284811 [Trichonephila clavipes]|uniref:Uncharacterized protein n=1 Tax=Trichonephila clavipes TaxID=2585209 RepID=A0A8X6SSX1_TRICX|nr:hypothetical protein TNCV_284811 [Trichonephila clavipes]